jgi:nitroreductase
MDFYDVLSARFSVRAFTPDVVPEDVLLRVLEAVRVAPSACNLQPWHFYVVRDEALRQATAPGGTAGWAAKAPVLIVACLRADAAWVRKYDGKRHGDVDMGIAMEHLALAAAAEGLGTCWICAFDPQTVRTALELPAELEPVVLMPLGYPAQEPPPRSRKPLADIVTWR